MPEDEHVSELAQQNEELRAEVESLKTSRSRAGRLRLRRIMTAILVVLTSISVVATTAGVWMNRTIWNTDRFVALVAPLSDNRAVTDGLAVKLAEDTFQALDVQERVQQALASIPQLPEGADALLAGPLTTSAQSLIEDKVKEFLASPAFDRLWIELNTRVHEKVVALVGRKPGRAAQRLDQRRTGATEHALGARRYLAGGSAGRRRRPGAERDGSRHPAGPGDVRCDQQAGLGPRGHVARGLRPAHDHE